MACEGAEERIYHLIKWSSDVMATGKMPDVDWDRIPWPEGSYRARLAGHFIANGMRFLINQILADWKFHKEAFKLRSSYSHQEICVRCFASKTGAFVFSDFRRLALHRAHTRTQANFLAQYDGLIPNLCRIYGFHSWMLCIDCMHKI